MIDHATQLLVTQLNRIDKPTVWYADENALTACEQVQANSLLTVVTNRFDIFQLLEKKKFNVTFTDFNPRQYTFTESPQVIIYRISKEKPLVHHLLNQSQNLLGKNGELMLCGLKNEGVKSYSDKLIKTLGAKGKLKKQGTAYIGTYSFGEKTTEQLDDQNYSSTQKVLVEKQNSMTFYSKPGVFGWNKIDEGTELLLKTFKTLMHQENNHAKKTILDLGCGYGWIGLSIDELNVKHITATDNNAAALLCAQKNAKMMNTPMQVIASNCANTIDDSFDIVLCNPPFHRGFQHHKDLTQLFLTQTNDRLIKGGMALFVVNAFIDIEIIAKNIFTKIDVIEKNKSFKVILLNK